MLQRTPESATGIVAASTPPCRSCGARLVHTFVDLGVSPLCETYLTPEQLDQMEPFYPLHVRVCHECFLVQLEQYVTAEDIFREYAYFSSYSTSWVEHARRYVESMMTRLELGPQSLVVELASNDGYLLRHFLPHGVPVLGVEPAENVAAKAVELGITCVTEFFGVELARRLASEGRHADLIVGNNVLAQVPDLHDFVGGMKILLAEGGTITLEFPHLERLVEGNQFDTIYHEHFSYFSLHTTERFFAKHGLVLYDVEEISTHGGSLRVYFRHAQDRGPAVTNAVAQILDRELRGGVTDLAYYRAFAAQVQATKRKLLRFLIEAKDAGKVVAGYGAPGKGNTLLNYCGIREDLLAFTVDRNPYKHGKFLPGTHIPVFDPKHVEVMRPDYLLILPWNLAEEIVEQTRFIAQWGGLHVVPIPEVRVIG